jgi:hypothetical protein
MIYFANPSNPQVRAAMREWPDRLGAITTPAEGNRIDALPLWCADNSCGPGQGAVGGHHAGRPLVPGKGWPGEARWLAWLTRLAPHASRCTFAVAPDVVGDAAATIRRSLPLLPLIRDLGYPAAFVAQNGQHQLPVPWDEFSVLFIGGDDTWKLGAPMRALATAAKTRGKWLHMGRVNSLKRMRYARAIGCDSADGTFIRFGPDIRLPEALGWLRDANDQLAFGEPEPPGPRTPSSVENPGDRKDNGL